MPTPLSHTSILFPSHQNTTTTNNINTLLKQLARQNLSTHNRLASIASDAAFIHQIAAHYSHLPVLANERCGSWYTPPELKGGSAYFKSTDGHNGEWGFSLRRLNVDVLRRVEEGGGCIIVDSTRRGKSMPDALSKTVPIWISVCNAAFGLEPALGDEERRDGKGVRSQKTGAWKPVLRTPESIVSPSEHAQIAARLPQFAEDFASTSLKTVREAVAITRPMYPIWITPNTAELPPLPKGKHPVILVTASGRTSPSIGNEEYVQGAADDAEAWAHGLTAELFWENKDGLLAASEEELPALIEGLLLMKRLNGSTGRTPILIKPTSIMLIADKTAAEQSGSDYDVVVCCSPEPIKELEEKLKSRYLHLKCSTTPKIGSRDLRAQLPKLVAEDSPLRRLSADARMLVTCPTGKDLAVGVALAVICYCIDEQGIVNLETLLKSSPRVTSKAEIKQRLSWIMVSMPDASPSRATLQSINDFVLR